MFISFRTIFTLHVRKCLNSFTYAYFIGRIYFIFNCVRLYILDRVRILKFNKKKDFFNLRQIQLGSGSRQAWVGSAIGTICWKTACWWKDNLLEGFCFICSNAGLNFQFSSAIRKFVLLHNADSVLWLIFWLL